MKLHNKIRAFAVTQPQCVNKQIGESLCNTEKYKQKQQKIQTGIPRTTSHSEYTKFSDGMFKK